MFGGIIKLKLYPRHYKLIEFLTSTAPKRFTVDALAKATELSKNTLGNELPNLYMDGHIFRDSHGRTYLYYIPKAKDRATKAVVKATPLQLSELEDLLRTTALPSYEPKLNRLGWKLPQSLFELAAVAQGQEGSQAACRKALSDLHEAAQTYTDILGRILATPQLWDDRLSQWLTEGLSEENLENLAELTRQGVTSHGRLTPDKQDTTTKEVT